MASDIFTELCNCHQFQNIFSTPERNPVSIRTCPLPPAASSLLSVPVICLFLRFHMNGIMWHFASGFLYNALKAHPCWSTYQCFVPFYRWIILLLFMDRQRFIDSSANAHWRCFYSLAILNYAAVNIRARVFGWTCFQFFWIHTWEGEMLGHRAMLCLTFWRIAKERHFLNFFFDSVQEK